MFYPCMNKSEKKTIYEEICIKIIEYIICINEYRYVLISSHAYECIYMHVLLHVLEYQTIWTKFQTILFLVLSISFFEFLVEDKWTFNDIVSTLGICLESIVRSVCVFVCVCMLCVWSEYL